MGEEWKREGDEEWRGEKIKDKWFTHESGVVATGEEEKEWMEKTLSHHDVIWVKHKNENLLSGRSLYSE